MKKFFYKYSHFLITRCLSAKILLILFGISAVTSAVLPMNMDKAWSQETSSESVEENGKLNPILQKMLGSWQVQPPIKPEKLTLVFGENSKLFLYAPNDKKGAELGYTIDTTKTPMHVDIRLQGEKEVVKTIAEFTADGNLKMQIEGTDPGNERPQKFAENVSILKKISDATILPKDVDLIDNSARSKPPTETIGKMTTKAMMRSQQAYFLEYNKFADRIADLGLDKLADEYSYELSRLKPRQVAIIANPKQPQEKSYLGLVYAVKSGNDDVTVIKMCQTQQPITKVPNLPSAPKTINSEIACPAGFTAVK